MVRRYRYVSVMFLFTVTWGYDYAVATLTPHGWATRPAEAVEARGMLGGQDLEPSVWQRFSLLIGVAVVFILVVGSALLPHS